MIAMLAALVSGEQLMDKEHMGVQSLPRRSRHDKIEVYNRFDDYNAVIEFVKETIGGKTYDGHSHWGGAITISPDMLYRAANNREFGSLSLDLHDITRINIARWGSKKSNSYYMKIDGPNKLNIYRLVDDKQFYTWTVKE